MRSRRRTAFAMTAIALASSPAAAPARAVPITWYAHVDFGADHVAARERIGASSGSGDATPDFALDLIPTPIDLSTASLAISFRRWDEGEIAGTSAVLAPVDLGF